MSGVAGNGGACCTCDQFASSGCGCGGTVPCSLDCRSKAGFASICGFSEFADVSDPPKKYRRLTNSGSLQSRVFQPSLVCDPATTIIDVTTTYSGFCLYSVIDCSFDSSGLVNGTCGNTNPTTGAHGEDTATESKMIGDGCRITSGIQSRSVDGTWTNSLSDEDTESDGINRANASIGSWSDCSLGSSAFITDRTGTGDFDFGYRSIQTRILWTAIIGRTYNVRVNFARRLLGSSGPYLDLGMPYEATVVADELSEHTDWIDVPNEAGWETVASGCVVEIQPE